MKKKIVRTGRNGRRSSCVAYGSTLYISGITTNDLDLDITEQTEDVFRQLDKLMEYHNTNKNHILTATVFLHTMEEYGKFNRVWDRWIVEGYEPTRSVVETKFPVDQYKVKVSLVVALEVAE